MKTLQVQILFLSMLLSPLSVHAQRILPDAAFVVPEQNVTESNTLNIQFEADAIANIQAMNLSVVVARSVGSSEDTAAQTVWAVIPPSEIVAATFLLEWDPVEFFAFQSDLTAQIGRIMRPHAQVPVLLGDRYDYDGSHLVANAQGSLNSEQIMLENLASTQVTFGLAASATLGGTDSGPVAFIVAEALESGLLTFTPNDEVFLFLSGNAPEVGEVVDMSNTGIVLEVSYTDTSSHTVRLNGQTNSFSLIN